VLAPYDGSVVGLQIAEGAYAVTGHPLFTLIKTDNWYAIADFRETEVPHIVVGDHATVWVMGSGRSADPWPRQSLGAGGQPDDGGGGADCPSSPARLTGSSSRNAFPCRCGWTILLRG
jgi:multidrug efflux system membrane fusion protein